MKKIISLLFLLILSVLLVSCSNETTKLTTKTTAKQTTSIKNTTLTTATTKKVFTPIQAEYDLVEDRSYSEYGERSKYDIYLPKDLTAGTELNVVLFVHGGAWAYGSKEDYATLINTFSKFIMGTIENTVLVAMNYRLLSFDAESNVTIYDMMDDIDACIKDVKEYLTTSGYLTSNLIIGGHSAGGHLALLYSYKYSNNSVIPLKFVFSLSGPTDIDTEIYIPIAETLIPLLAQNGYEDLANVETFMTLARNAVNASETDDINEKLADVSPINYVSTNKIPTIIFHGDKDAIVPYQNSLDLVTELENSGVKHTLITVKDGTHNDTCLYSKMRTKGFLEEFYNYYIEFVK